MNTNSRDNPYDALRKVINHEANQDDDGGFFARLGGIEPDNDDDGPTAKGLFQHMHRDKGGTPVRASYADNTGAGWNANKGRSSGPHLQWVKNTTGKIEDIITREEWDKANPPLRPDSSYGANYAHRRYGSKRKHAITVRKLSGWYGNFWKFSCTPCGLSINYPTWETAYHQATRHAHNNH